MVDYNEMKHIQVEINGTEYNLLWAQSDEEKEYGLKGCEELESGEGMFFDYRNEPQAEISFWMQDCDVPLDIIFVGEDDIVLSVQKGKPLSEEFLTENNVFYVIELAQNSGVKTGDEVEILDEINTEELPKNEMLVLNSDGSVQFSLQGGERIFSRRSSKIIIKKAKKANASLKDGDYKSLGRYIFSELDRQTARPEEYVEN